jgi:hypothetical protein
MRITGLVARLVLEESAQFMRITGLVARLVLGAKIGDKSSPGGCCLDIFNRLDSTVVGSMRAATCCWWTCLTAVLASRWP